MLTDLKREVVALVVQTTAAVTGKVLTAGGPAAAGRGNPPPIGRLMVDSAGMKISKQARREARQLFRACLAANRSMKTARARPWPVVIARKSRAVTWPSSPISIALVRLDVARRTAKIESATALSPQLQAQVQSDLTPANTAPAWTFTFTANPALIGGVRIQVGGDVYDGSVQGAAGGVAGKFLNQ